MRSPFTGIVFAIELTHDLNVLLPLLVANALAYTVSVLLLKRSILTEKVSRRGFHLSREYAVDPLEVLFAREVMETNVTAFTEYTPCGAAVRAIPAQPNQALYPVLKEENNLAGVVTRNDIRNLAAEGVEGKPVGTVLRRKPVVAYAGEPLRVIVYRMASSGFTQMPVLEEPGKNRLVGMISLEGLLRARAHNLSEERDREQVIRIRLPFGLLTANEDREESHRANR